MPRAFSRPELNAHVTDSLHSMIGKDTPSKHIKASTVVSEVASNMWSTFPVHNRTTNLQFFQKNQIETPNPPILTRKKYETTENASSD